MKTLVCCYSNTGNNELIAKKIAEKTGAELEMISFPKKDMKGAAMIHISLIPPKVPELKKDVTEYDHVVFVTPTWMGRVARPMKQVMKKNRKKIKSYSLISFCGGALGRNEKLKGTTAKLMKSSPRSFSELIINDIMPAEKKDQMKETSAFRLDEEGFKFYKSSVDDFCSMIST